MKENDHRSLEINLDKLLIYRNLLEDDIIKNLRALLNAIGEKTRDQKKINHIYYELLGTLIDKAEEQGYEGNVFQKYIIHLLFSDENRFSLYFENNRNSVDSSLYHIILEDIKIIMMLLDFNIQKIEESIEIDINLLDYKPIQVKKNFYEERFQTAKAIEDKRTVLIEYYSKYGCGIIGQYSMFRWNQEKGLVGIEHYDQVQLSDLIGYEYQKQQLIKNTEAFLNGYSANNILLVGARGTGKSSSVKALVNQYFEQDLRLLEISKEQIIQFPRILQYLQKRGKKFIVFIDDLSFEDFEIEYKYMKSLLEGSTEKKPDNVLFYATSNRRHLIQEKWADRQGNQEDEEIHGIDVMNEKMSLSDRFGITITYSAPTQAEYLEIVMKLAQKEGVKLSEEIIKRKAIQWEMAQKGRSGRTARQFITALKAFE